MKNKDKIKEEKANLIICGILFVLLFLFAVYSFGTLMIRSNELQLCQEELDIPENLVFKYSCYWENLGIYQEIHLELDDFETYNGWLYKLKNEDLYRYCEVIK